MSDKAPEPVLSTPAPTPVDPFSDNNWEPTPDNPTPPAPPVVDPPAPAPAPAPAPESEADVFDADAYLKEQLGFESWDAAKASVQELNDLREKAKTPAEYRYANEVSERIAKAINEGDDETVFRYLDQKRKITTGKALDAANAEHAADIIKLNWQLQNQDLSSDDVDFMFRKKFSTPRKPEQAVDQTDAEYAEQVSEWQSRVNDIKREMTIEAKLAKPNLAKYESQLVLPDTAKKQAAPAEPAPPTPEELATREADRQRYLSVTGTDIKNLKEFKALVKDEEVEIPVSYLVSDEEKTKTKSIVESLYTSFDYFIERWKNPDGSLNGARQAEDITLLENREKIFQKIANESSAKRMAHKVTASKNPVIQPNSGNGKPVLQTSDKDKATADFWQNS